MEESLSIWVVARCLSHCHLHCARTNRTLQQSLTLIFLRLRLVDREDVIAKLAIKVVDLFLEAEAAFTFLALHAKVHLLQDKLSAAVAFVMYVRRFEFCESPHLTLNTIRFNNIKSRFG